MREVLPIVPMSSDRLFLDGLLTSIDRPLHWYAQIIMPLRMYPQKPDISTLP